MVYRGLFPVKKGDSSVSFAEVRNDRNLSYASLGTVSLTRMIWSVTVADMVLL